MRLLLKHEACGSNPLMFSIRDETFLSVFFKDGRDKRVSAAVMLIALSSLVSMHVVNPPRPSIRASDLSAFQGTSVSSFCPFNTMREDLIVEMERLLLIAV